MASSYYQKMMSSERRRPERTTEMATNVDNAILEQFCAITG